MQVSEPATEQSAQDVESRIEAALFGGDEPEVIEGDVVVEGEATLPEADDTDPDSDDGSEDLEETMEATEEDLSLAEYLGIPDDRLVVGEDGSLMYNAIVDGEEKPVALTDLTKSYQLQGHVNNKSMALEAERKEFKEQQASIAAQLKERVEGMDTMTNFLETELMSEFNGINWDQLRMEAPSEWAALRQEYAEKAQKVMELKNISTQEKQRLMQEQQATNQAAMQEHLRVERERMIQANPTWVDTEVLASDMNVLKDFVKSTYGFNDEDTKLVTDHRLIGLIQDAHKFRAGTVSAESKKAKIVPKFQKSGASRKQQSHLVKARGIKAKRAAVKSSNGSIDSVAKLLEDRM